MTRTQTRSQRHKTWRVARRGAPGWTWIALKAWICCFVALAGCGKSRDAGSDPKGPISAEAIGPQECAACGMVVREQPAPRAQLRHRDGTRAFFCSIGDLVQYQQAPSRHGKVTDTFVEVLPVDVDPETPDMKPRPWLPAAKVHYLLGAKRRGIMGPPVLSFATRVDADAARKRLMAAAGENAAIDVHDWAKLPAAVLKAAQRPHAH